MRKRNLLFVAVMSVCAQVWGDGTRGRLDAVTVYCGQALVSRTVEVAGEPGVQEMVIVELPARVLPGSLYAESGESIDVRSLRFRTRAVDEDVREDVRKIDEQIETINLAIASADRSSKVLASKSGYLDKLEQFVAVTANTELTRGVLNAETLTKLSEYMFTQRQQIAENGLELETKINALRKDLDLANRKRGEITSGASKVQREAVLVLNVKQPGKIKVKYLVEGASWSPSYAIHAKSGEASVQLAYQAAVSQMTGEDWTDVQMTLSTATPSVTARAPSLEPLTIMLAMAQPAAAGQQIDELSRGYADELRARRGQAQMSFNNTGNQIQQRAGGGSEGALNLSGQAEQAFKDNNFQLNKAAKDLQVLEYKARDKELAARVAANNESLTVTYELPSRTSLPSRADEQLIGIATLNLKGDFYKLAVPVLTNYVYNEALVDNDGKTLLLAGPAMSYFDGQFVGNAQMPTVAIGEKFTVGFGIDSSLRVSRELAERDEKVQGGNRIATFTYKIALENFGASPAKVRVMDRMPTQDGSQLKATLMKATPELSKDSEYERTEKKKGILRWDLDVKPQAIGASAATVSYDLMLEYDKQMTIGGMGK
jgi:hypothetical protein